MTNEIDQAVRQTQRYRYEDGLVEMATGLLFLGVGLGIFSWLAFTEVSGTLGFVLIVLLVALAVGGGLLIKKAVEEMKQRITYPRTGYVAYREDEKDRGKLVVIIAALLLSVLIYLLPPEFGRMSSIVGGILAVVLAYLGYRLGLKRFYITGLIALVLGLAMSLLFEDEYMGTAVTIVTCGAALLVSGASALFSYLQTHPKASEDLS